MIFAIFITFIILQRVCELRIARSNEEWIKQQGGYEVGSKHYPYIVLLHGLFFVALVIESSIKQFTLVTYWPVPFVIFLAAQVLRFWSILSLGRYWNTKILILPNARLERKGPYRWFKHPNYVVVVLEIIVIPLIFGAYLTAVIFSVLNALLLGLVRIPAEEKALSAATNYRELFK